VQEWLKCRTHLILMKSTSFWNHGTKFIESKGYCSHVYDCFVKAVTRIALNFYSPYFVADICS
jgi:hypothetical protein